MPPGALGIALASALALALGSCGSAATPSPAISPTSAPIPQASFTGGTASARAAIPAKVTWEGGWCTRGTDDAWLALNIGSPNGAEYFGLVVGQSPYTPAATRGAAGGGTFVGNDAVVTWRHLGIATAITGGGLVVEVAKDLTLGSFKGTLADGTEVSGSFSC